MSVVNSQSQRESRKNQKHRSGREANVYLLLLFSKITHIPHYVTRMDPPQLPSSFRDPAKLFYQKDSTRRSIVIAYWSIIILAVPLWWSTTSIERLSLPSHRVHQQAKNHLQLPVRICLQTVDEHLFSSVRASVAAKMSLEPQRWGGLAVDVFGKANCGMPFILFYLVCR